MKFNTIVSVDPGLAGGLSMFVNNKLVACISMPTVKVETKPARYKFDLLNGKKQFIKSGSNKGKPKMIQISALKDGQATTVKAFGAECEGKFLLGLNEKPVQCLVRLSVNTSRPEGEAFREKNDIEGVLPKDHADIEKFKAKVEKYNGKFHYRGYVKKDTANAGSSAGSEEVKAAAEKLDF